MGRWLWSFKMVGWVTRRASCLCKICSFYPQTFSVRR